MASKAVGWIRLVPNELTGLRLVLAAVFPFLPGPARLPVVLVSAATDWLDGWFARRFGAQSAVGGLLDAFADKTFVLSVLCTLASDGALAWWQVPVLLVRDVAVAFTVFHFAVRREWAAFASMPARRWGKITTLFVFAFFVVLLTASLEALRLPIFLLAAASSLVAGVDYLTRFARVRRGGGDGQGPSSMEE